MIKNIQIKLLDLIVCLSDTMDLINPAITNHHKQVAYIAVNIAKGLKLSKEKQNKVLIAGALHDIGALTLKDKMSAMDFEGENLYKHAELGYLLLKAFHPFLDIAKIIRFHHVPWSKGEGAKFNKKTVTMESHILHLADRISVLINKNEYILAQNEGICEKIKNQADKMFMPEIVDVFLNLAGKEFFWFDVVSPYNSSLSFTSESGLPTMELNINELTSLTKVFSHIIDFRSRFTATHSSGVAVVSEALARLIGFSERECQMIKIAGYLHDLGKLAVPAEIIEKTAKLTDDEFNIIRAHSFHTYRSLDRIQDLEMINTWASFHHERLDGAGYPFHHKGKNLPLGARIMAIADVFTAITEDRPYRKGMPEDKALVIIQKMAAESALDSTIVELLTFHFTKINAMRMSAQKAAGREYQEFYGSTER